MPNTIQAPCIYPTFRYADPAAIIDWLCNTAGFSVHASHSDDAGNIVHAELALGSSIIMLGQHHEDAYGGMVGGPGKNGGKSLYIAIEDVDALFEKVKASGVKIEEEPVDRDYGSREFICRDAEGNLWCFGTYRPTVNG